jgi:hypothetical protein
LFKANGKVISGPGRGGAEGDAVAVGSEVGEVESVSHTVAVGVGEGFVPDGGVIVGLGVTLSPGVRPQALKRMLAIRSKRTTVPGRCWFIFSPWKG